MSDGMSVDKTKGRRETSTSAATRRKTGVVLGVGEFAALERLDEEEVTFQREEELNEGGLCDVPQKEAMGCD